MYNFTVKSKIHDYNVDFITNIEDSFSKQLIESDFIIIDKKVYSLFNEKLSTNYLFLLVKVLDLEYYMGPMVLHLHHLLKT